MGVIVKAASVGGLEALLRMLEERGIPVRRADIGDITKNDIVDAEVVGDHDPYLAAILGFDSKVLPEAKEYVGSTQVFVSAVIYEVIDNYALGGGEEGVRPEGGSFEHDPPVQAARPPRGLLPEERPSGVRRGDPRRDAEA
jgi:translation initiation factor IF-2